MWTPRGGIAKGGYWYSMIILKLKDEVLISFEGEFNSAIFIYRSLFRR